MAPPRIAPSDFYSLTGWISAQIGSKPMILAGGLGSCVQSADSLLGIDSPHHPCSDLCSIRYAITNSRLRARQL
jgi:hypothetical protein